MIRRLFALALAAVAVAGCMKLKHKTVVMPDGSGKVVVTMAMSRRMYAMAKLAASSDRKKGDPPAPDPLVPKLSVLAKSFEGCVAIAQPERFEKDGFVWAVVTAYFEDANKFRVVEQKEEEEAGDEPPTLLGAMSYRFERSDEGFKLTVVNEMLEDQAKDLEEQQAESEKNPEMEKLAKTLLAGLEIGEAYELPGDVTSADEPLVKAGRTASFSAGIEEALADDPAVRKRNSGGTRTLTCGKSTLTEAEVKAFRDELAAAKAAWPGLLAADEAKYAPKKEEAEKETPAEAPDAGK